MKPIFSVYGMSVLSIQKGQEQITNYRIVFWVKREGGHYSGQGYYAGRYKDFKILPNTPFEPFEYYNIKNDEIEANKLEFHSNPVYKTINREPL